MKNRLVTLILATVFALSITACGSSAPTNTPAGGGVVESSVVEATAEPTEAPTPEPTAEPTPEPTATPEPTPEPTPFVMPEEPTVYIDGIEITLPCTWGEFMGKTHHTNYYDWSEYTVWVDAYGRDPEPEDLVYGILQGDMQGTGEQNSVALPGDIKVGTEITKEELIELYGEPTYLEDSYGVCLMVWGFCGSEARGYEVWIKDGVITDTIIKLPEEMYAE